MADVNDEATSDGRYAALCDHASRTARQILSHGPGGGSSGSAAYLYRRSEQFVAGHRSGDRPRPDCGAADALDAVARAYPAIRAGDLTGEEVFALHDGLWGRLMTEWPMGDYARMAADALASLVGAGGTVVELGAGVGATTRLIQPIVRARGGRLVATDLLYRGARAADFDRPLVGQVPGADVVVATNALHCSADPAVALRHVAALLEPGGALVLAEGAPFPTPGVPWALDLLFGACGGWFDRGGFRTPEFWLGALRAAGFVRVERIRWPSGRYYLGGCFVATAPGRGNASVG
ncbi:methyltransferase domain-containing protein [Micromonospora sp. NPDC048999]|uniref:methyltransferase domain-containing protein n=1 Tax=Micromonospora sp. NPDC048999 TaxID=3155391 RepID=UPI0033DCC49E